MNRQCKSKSKSERLVQIPEESKLPSIQVEEEKKLQYNSIARQITLGKSSEGGPQRIDAWTDRYEDSD